MRHARSRYARSLTASLLVVLAAMALVACGADSQPSPTLVVVEDPGGGGGGGGGGGPGPGGEPPPGEPGPGGQPPPGGEPSPGEPGPGGQPPPSGEPPPGGPGPGGDPPPDGPPLPGPPCGAAEWFPDLGRLARILANVPGFEPLGDPFPSDCPGMSGDVHVHTFDSNLYDFQAVGEYVAVRSASGDMEVQVRLVPAGSSGRVSMVRGVALTVDGRTLVIDNGVDPAATLDGTALAMDATVVTDAGAIIVRDGGVVGVFWPDPSTTITVTGVGRTFLNVYATLDRDRAGSVNGLLGDADGSAANEPALPDGAPVDDTFEAIHGELRDAWRVADDQSLFAGASTFDPAYPTAASRLTAEQRASARQTCLDAGVVVRSLFDNCVTDVGVTGDDAWALRYADEQLPRRHETAPCGAGVGEPVSMDGLGPGRPFRADARLIEGEPAWEFVPDTRLSLVRGVAVTPEGFLAVDLQQGFHVLDRNGQRQATIPGRPIAHAPAVTTERAYVITSDSPADFWLTSLTLDGTVCWQLAGYDVERFRTVVVADGRLVVTSYHVSSAFSTVLALDPATGTTLWSRSFNSALREPAVADGRVVVGLDNGVAVLGLDNGQTAWTSDGRALAVSASGGVAYVADWRGDLVAHDLQSGDIRWTFSGRMQRIAVADEHVVGVGDRRAYGIDARDGSPLWVLGEDERTAFGQPVVIDGAVYFFAEGRGLVAHSLDTGRELLRVPLPERAWLGAPVPAGDLLLVFDDRGVLRAYR